MKTEQVITWAILIWGFTRLRPVYASNSLGATPCPFGPMTQTLTVPPWLQLTGQQLTIEGEQ